MHNIFRWIKVFLIVIITLAFVFYVLGFTLQLIGFTETVSREGFREALSPAASNDIQFYASAIWLVAMVIATYVVPIAFTALGIIYYRKRKHHK